MTRSAQPVLRSEEIENLCQVLAAETSEYRRLLRLSRRQNRYLRGQDAERLENNAREWEKYLPLADQAHQRRREYVDQVARRLQLPPQRFAPQFFLSHAEKQERGRLAAALDRLGATAAELGKQNALNRRLARFCLDLAREEAEIFKQVVLEDPAGCYAGDARKSQASPGGVFVRQA